MTSPGFIPKFKYNMDFALRCPFCGEGNLHQNEIEIFERNREDCENGLHIIVKGTSTSPCSDEEPRELPSYSIDNSMDWNPSSRRQAVSIRFWCEHCKNIPCLNIFQVAGQTAIEWERFLWTR